MLRAWRAASKFWLFGGGTANVPTATRRAPSGVIVRSVTRIGSGLSSRVPSSYNFWPVELCQIKVYQPTNPGAMHTRNILGWTRSRKYRSLGREDTDPNHNMTIHAARYEPTAVRQPDKATNHVGIRIILKVP